LLPYSRLALGWLLGRTLTQEGEPSWLIFSFMVTDYRATTFVGNHSLNVVFEGLPSGNSIVNCPQFRAAAIWWGIP